MLRLLDWKVNARARVPPVFFDVARQSEQTERGGVFELQEITKLQTIVARGGC